MAEIVERLRGGLIVSCQPVVGGPMDTTEFVVGFARAAADGGAAGLRIEGVANVRAVRDATSLPIIGLVKHADPHWPVYITPTAADATALAAAGADIVAFDATLRPRPQPVAQVIAAIHASGKLAMADIASREDAGAALAQGADVVGTTLSGYAGAQAQDGAEDEDGPDIGLVRICADLGATVLAEGRYRTLEHARDAVAAGATAVVIGSAITRPEHITAWFAQAMRETAASPRGR